MIKSMPIKLIISFITIILLASIFYIPPSHAIGDIMGEGKGFLNASNGENSVINDTVLKSTSDSIYNTLLAMAIIIAVIVAMILGIQFMVAAADEKAKIKEALMPFIVGCIVVFGSFTIWKVIISIGNSAENEIVATPSQKEILEKTDSNENKTLTKDEWCETMYNYAKSEYFIMPQQNETIQNLYEEPKDGKSLEGFYEFLLENDNKPEDIAPRILVDRVFIIPLMTYLGKTYP